MEARKLLIDGLEIAVYESNGTGPAVLLIHGNSASASTFQPQFDSELAKKFRLIALDLPGHGKSSRALNPTQTYTAPGYARVLVAAVHQLGLDEYVLIGWSLGGHIVLEASTELKARGYLIYGTPPVANPPAMDKAFLPNPAMGAGFKADLTPEEIKAYGEAAHRPQATIPADFYTGMEQTDGQAREVMGRSIGEGNYKDEVEIIANLNVPLAILQGEYEQLVNPAYFSTLVMPTLWRGAVQIVQGAGHTIHREQPAQFNFLVEQFWEDLKHTPA